MTRSITLRRGFVALMLATVSIAQMPRFAVVEESVPGDAHYVLAADLDGDGDLDLLGESGASTALNGGDGRMSLGWTGAPSGAYFASPSSTTNINRMFQPVPTATAVYADFNGDGIGDFIVSEGSSPNVNVRLRLGLAGGGINPTGGTLLLTFTPGLPSYARGLAAGDVDGDGDHDLIICCEWTQGLRLRRNSGGSLPDVTSGSGLAAGAVTAATLKDLDGDGDLDLVVHGAAWGPMLAFVQENLGGGVFGAPLQLAGTQTSERAPVVGDFDGDGFKDIVRFGGPSAPVAVQLSVGPWVYATPIPVVFAPGPAFEPTDVATADLDGDGKDELIVAGRRAAATFRLVGGAFVPYAPEIEGPCDSVLLFDADQDGDPDALTSAGTYSLTPTYRFLLNHDGGVLTGIAGALHAVGGLVILSPNGFGVTSTTVPIRSDVDGAPDVLTITLADTAAGSRIWRSDNDGHGVFQAPAFVPCADLPAGFAIAALPGYTFPSGAANVMPRAVAADFDLDGDDDVLVCNAAASTTTQLTVLLRNDGPAGFFALPVASRLFRTNEVVAADLNGDGLPDFVEAATNMAVWLSTPAGLVASTAIPATTATDVAAGDFDGDGDLDLALGTTAAFAAIWVNSGGGAFTLGPIINGPSGPIEAADFNGDGACDFTYGNALYLRTGPLQFAAAVGLPTTPSNARRTVLDVDADGDPDLLCQDGTILRNDGASTFTSFASLPESTGAGIPVDVDRDGDIDVVRPMGPKLFTNLARQVVPRTPIRPGFTTGFDVYGPPNGACLVGVSSALLTPPVATPYGSLSLDPFTFVPLAQGPLDAVGRAAWFATLDPTFGATLIGTTFVLQAVVDDGGGLAGPRLTNARVPTVYGP